MRPVARSFSVAPAMLICFSSFNKKKDQSKIRDRTVFSSSGKMIGAVNMLVDITKLQLRTNGI